MCDPLGDSNTVYFVAPRNKTTPSNGTRVESDRSVIVVAARMDALALFDQVEVGFDSPSTGLVTLLATAELVAEAFRTTSSFKSGVENIMFLLLQGESFDYIGSSRLVYDMQHDAFPFNLTEALAESRFLHNGTQPLLAPGKVKAWLELGQLGIGRPGAASSPLFLHERGDAADMMAALGNNAPAGLDVKSSRAGALPPCSAQSVLKERKDLPTVLVTNYDTQFQGDMYHR
jgi:nicastrin